MSDPWPPSPPDEPVPTKPGAAPGPSSGLASLEAPRAAGSAASAAADRVPGAVGSQGAVEMPGAVEVPDSPDPARPSANRRALTIALGTVVVLLIAAALAAGPVAAPGTPTFPPVGASAAPAGAGAAAARSAVAAALAAVGLQTEDVLAPHRPAEAARLAAAPRLVVRATLPDDPDHGRIVIYEFVTPNDASVAAGDQAAYIASGVGRVQFPPDTRFIIRVVDSAVVFFAWSPEGSPDPRTSRIAEALATLGLQVVVPN